MDVKRAFEHYYLLEKQFWSGLSASEIKHVTFEGDLRPEDMLLYGEFGFALLALKPCVLVEFRDEKVTRRYSEQVIQPVLATLAEPILAYFTITQQVTTPESDLTGSGLIYHRDHAQLIKSFDHPTRLTEATMAHILDYPGHLPRSQQELATMHTVLYLHHRPPYTIALTTFAIQTHEKEHTSHHFQKYRHACQEKLNITLKLLIQ
ncbi:hypothetical protein BY458DRAFT_499290 [Sporodiniella umbellata]|nr:hypothetical protein BY458DRAFT_499290 [Sporodiniella umbellata]